MADPRVLLDQRAAEVGELRERARRCVGHRLDRAQALDVATNLLQANSDVTGIFAENDEMALGAIQALGDRAGTDVKVVGFDGTEDALAAIQAGTMTATIAQQPSELGKRSVELMAQLLAGETVESNVPVPVTTVTEENAEEFIK